MQVDEHVDMILYPTNAQQITFQVFDLLPDKAVEVFTIGQRNSLFARFCAEYNVVICCDFAHNEMDIMLILCRYHKTSLRDWLGGDEGIPPSPRTEVRGSLMIAAPPGRRSCGNVLPPVRVGAREARVLVANVCVFG